MPSDAYLLTLPAPRGRIIVIGDIHGCYEELWDLLERLQPAKTDLVIAAGDVVRKGPHAARCVDLLRARRYHSVFGNNEEKLLHEASRPRIFLPAEDRAVLRRRELVAFIERWPRVVHIPDRNIAVVHGGLFPDMPVKRTAIERASGDVIRLRWIRREGGRWRRSGKTRRSDADVLWSELWSGPATILYGHTPLREPRVDRYAIGLDTGCVYGGTLTAAVHEGGKWHFESVPARRQYAK